ncbi:MAG: hypothetical protein U0164_23895 [Gemmatimonadaceae bacterium]
MPPGTQRLPALLAALVLALAPWTARAQDRCRANAAVEYQAPFAALGAGVTRLSLGDAPDDVTIPVVFVLDAGYRLPPLCWTHLPVLTNPRLRLTPLVSFAVSSIDGADARDDKPRFASIDMGVRLTYRPAAAPRLRPLLEWRSGKRSLDRFDSDRVVANYGGSGQGWRAGVEVVRRGSDRGFIVTVQRLDGSFRDREVAGDIQPRALDLRAWSLHLSWGGRFTGVSIPWR